MIPGLQDKDNGKIYRIHLCINPHPVRKVTNTEKQGEETGGYVGSTPEPVFLNVYGAQESIPRNELRQAI